MNWILVLTLVAVSLPGLLVALPGLIRALPDPPDRPKPPTSVLVAVASAQSLVLVALAAILGAWLAPQVGLEAPFFGAFGTADSPWEALRPQILPGLLWGGLGALPFLAAYYGLVRRVLDRPTVVAMENVRHQTGLLGRVLYGGVVEEILARWALVPLFAWLASLAFGATGPLTIWIGIVLAGVLFAFGHAPAYLAAGCRSTPAFWASMLALNLFASVVFGVLFWQVGLAAAMMGHAMFHVVWWPLDQRFRAAGA